VPDLLASALRLLTQTRIRTGGCSGFDPGFFADLIENRAYARADREKGRFRSFLLGALKHFIADARDRGQALKRRGGMILVKLDDKAIAEAEAQIARAAKWQADDVYDREWAASLLRQALDRLAQECALTGKAELFGYLKPYLAATEESTIPYEEMARRSHRPVTTLRSDVARLRKRYCVILREEVRHGPGSRGSGRGTEALVSCVGRSLKKNV
jgi:DNA-directed RNA polymerase specialized sigma24 family protein